jgi:murein DD-endopeptidase MepM/ murein hydrolase activator NlpD
VAGRGVTTVYAHLHIRERIRLGMRIHEGELIGWVGRILDDPHLHLEVWMNGKSLAARRPEKVAQRIDGGM